MRDFLFGHTRVWTQDLWISSPALLQLPHCDLCFSPLTFFRYLTLVQRDWWWYCSDWTCERFSFCPHWVFEPRTSGSLVHALYHCTKATSGFHLWQFQVFDSGAEGLVVVLILLDLWEIFFLASLVFEPGTSRSLVLPSTTVPQALLVFTSDNLRYLTLVQVDWWWYCSDCERFSFWPHWGLNQDLWISIPALYHCATGTSGFHLWQFEVFNSGAERLVVVLFWLWEIFFLAHTGVWTQHLLISSPALYHCAMVTCGFSPLTISGI